MKKTQYTEYLSPTKTIESGDTQVREFAYSRAGAATNDSEKAVNIYYAVRDEIRYDPYSFEMGEDGFRASRTLANGFGWCIPKAVLLAACYRAIGIPSRLGFADVRNHLSTQRMRDSMNTDIFYWHGYTSVFLHDKWVKATPAFNLSLCEKFNLKPLEFDGASDSIYHAFDNAGNKHMEYLNERGEFADLPFLEMLATFERVYGGMKESKFRNQDFDADVELETGVVKRSAVSTGRRH